MLGIKDPWIWSAYVLCVISAVMCVVYGALNWNKGAEPGPNKDDKDWAKEEDQLSQNF